MHDEIIELSIEDCILWKYADRQAFEMGNLEALAADIKNNGQIQPIIVRENIDKYEIIAGQRRWRACHMINAPVLAVVKNVSDSEALLIQSSENIKKSISPYSKACCYGKILQDEKISQNKLASKLNISKGHLSDLLSFNDVPSEIWEAVVDVSKVSVRTAVYLKKIINEDEDNLHKILYIASHIKKGVGKRKIDELLNRKDEMRTNETMYDNYNNKVITFKEKEIKLHDNFFQYSSLEEIQSMIVKHLNNLLKRRAN